MGEQLAFVQEDDLGDEERLGQAVNALEDALEATSRARDMDAFGEDGVRSREQALEVAADAIESADVDVDRTLRYYRSGDDVCPTCDANLVLVESRDERTWVCRHCDVVETEQRRDAPNAQWDGLAIAGVGAGAVAMLGPWFPTQLGVGLIVFAAGGRLLARYRDEWQSRLETAVQGVVN